MRRFFTRGDIILTGTLTLLALASFGGVRLADFSGTHVVVTVDGSRVLELPLDRDARMPVRGPLGDTVIRVEDGFARIEDSPCPDKLCMHMGRIRRVGETLICVPNRVCVTIRGNGGGKQQFDGVSE